MQLALDAAIRMQSHFRQVQAQQLAVEMRAMRRAEMVGLDLGLGIVAHALLHEAAARIQVFLRRSLQCKWGSG